MNKYDVNDWLFLSLIISEAFANNDSIREKSYTEVLSYLCISFKDLVENVYEDLVYDELPRIAGQIKDLVSWSDQDLAKVEQFALNGGDLDTPIVEVIS